MWHNVRIRNGFVIRGKSDRGARSMTFLRQEIVRAR